MTTGFDGGQWLGAIDWSEGAAHLELAVDPDGETRLVERDGCSLVVAGDLARDPLEAYLQEGAAAFARFRGRFVFALVDGRRQIAYVVRDPMGEHPLFFAQRGARLVFSPDAETVARADGAKPELDRLAAAAFLLRTEVGPVETLFAGVHRLMQGHMLEVHKGRATTSRYWLPGREDGDAGEFSARLRQAVERTLAGRAAIFLSGGLDSALVAAVAADASRAHGLEPPVALSLAFPGDPANEEPMQRAIASGLGLELVVRTPAEAVGAEGLLAAALRCARRHTPHPPELLAGAYTNLGRLGVASGAAVFYDGAGGDEWLMPPPGWPADLVLALDVRGLATLVRAADGYWPQERGAAALRGVVWREGIRAAGLSLVAAAEQWSGTTGIQRVRRSRALARIPDFIAPDPELRTELARWIVAGATPAAPRSGTEHSRRRFLEAASLSRANESAFAFGRSLGARTSSPLLDGDVIDLLYDLTPGRLVDGGHAKALAREVLVESLGRLAYEWPRTVFGNTIWHDTIRAEAPGAWSTEGGAPRVAAAGIAAEAGVSAILGRTAPPPSLQELNWVWRLLSLESWLAGVEERSFRV